MSSHGSNAAASQSTSPSTCTPSTTTRRKPSKDIGWEYGTADPSVAGRVVCNLCKVLNGGIRRLKEHLIGGLGNCTGCPGASIEIQKKVKKFMVSKKEQAISRKKIQMAINMRDDVFEIDDDDVDPKKDDEPMILGSTGGSAILSGSGGGGVSNLRKRDVRTFLKTNVKGPLGTLLMPDPSKKMKQKCLDDDNPHKQKLRDVACEKIAIWSYEAGVAFNAFRLSSFQTMVNAIGYYGKDMPAPTYHEMKTTLLKVVYEKQKAFVDSFRGYWATYGCSIMADWWTDGKQRTLINFLVNCPQGTVFLKSIDGSDFKKDHTLIVDYINEVIKEVGEENIVQFITDNASNFKTAGAVLEGQHPTMFWTPCAAHCVNLILQDIAKSSSKIKNVLVEARAIVVYIYNHGRVLNLMRQFTNGELHRSAVTRFATSFYTLQSLHKNKQALRKMFVCDKWVKSDFAKKLDGKHVQNIIARGAFWDNVLYACRIMAPLVDIIRLVDTEEKPCMGYIYEGLDRAKEQIEKNLGESLRRTTNKIWAIIDKRWETQLHHPLHAAGFYLNPAIYYKQTTLAIEGNAEIKRGLRKAISKLVPNEDENDRVFDQLADFREVKGDFGDPRAIRRRETLQPYEWWMQFGASTPDLQKFALKVLGQTCSASPCERNWSTFDHAVNIGDKSLISKLVSTQLLQRETEKHEKIISNCTTTDALLSGAGELNEPIVPKRVLAQRKRRERERLAGVLPYPLPPRYFPSLVPTARVLAARRRRSEMQKDASNGANLLTLPSSKNGIQPSVLMEISQRSSKQAKVMHSPASPSEQHILPETPTEMDNALCNETTPEMDCTYLKNTVDAMSSQLQQVRQEDIHSIPPPEKTGEKFLMSELNEGVLAQLKSDQMEPIHHGAPFTCSSSMLRTSATAQNENSASQLNSAQLELIHPQISSICSFSVEVTFTVPQKGVTTEINSAQLDPTNLQPPSTSSLSISSMSAVPQKGGVATQLEPTHLQRLSTCSLSMPNRSAASKNDMRSISELPLLKPRHFQPPSTSFKAMDIDNENFVSKRVLAQRLRRGREKNEKGIHKCTTTDALPVATGKINQSTVSNLRVSRGELNQPTVSNLRVSRRELNHPTVYSLPVSRWGLNHPTVSNLPVSRGELNQPTVSNLRVSRSELNQPTVSNLPVSRGELNHPTISNLPVTRRELNHPTVSNLPVSRGELNQPTVSNLPVARGELNQPTVSNRPVAMESTVSKHGPQRSPREWLRLVRVLPLPPKYLRSLIPSVRVFSQRRWSEMEREANMQKTSTLSSITNRIQPSDVADVPQHLPKRPKITTSLPSSSAQNTLQDTSTQSDYATCKGTPLSVDTMEGHPRQTSQAVLHSMPLSRNTGEKCLMKESNEGISYQMEPAQLQPCSTSSSSILSTSAALRNEDPVQQPPSACSFSMENTSIDPQIRGIAAQREASQLEASDLEPFSRGSFSMLRTSAAPQIGVAAQLEQTHLQPPSTCLFSLRNTFAAPENDMPIISESPQLEPGHLQPHSTCSKLLSKNAKITTSLPALYAQDTLQDTPTRSHYATCKETLLSVDTMIGHLQQTSQAGLHSPLLPRNTGKTCLIKEFSEDISVQMEPTQLQPCSTFSSSILSTAAALHNEGTETQQMLVEFELVHVQQPPATCSLFMDNTSIDPQLGGTAAQMESSQFEAPDLEPLSRGSFSMLSASAAPQIGVAAQLEQTHFEPPSTCLFSLPNTSAALENDTPSISESQNLDPRHLQPPSTSYTFAAPENDMPSISESSKLEPRHLQPPSPYSKKEDAPKELNINLRPPTQEVGCRIPRKKAEEYRVKDLHSAVAVLKKKARSFPVPSIFQRRKAGR